MITKNLLQLQDEFSRNGILISFSGPFSHSIIEEVGIAAKNYLEAKTEERGTISDVFSIYIEQTQNVRKYVQQRNLMQYGMDSAIVVISQAGDEYTVASGNFVLNADVVPMQERLTEVNALDKEELKQRYRLELRKERKPESLGAGVGILEMARRASHKLAFTFEEVTSEFSFFTLSVTVGGIA